MPHVDIKMFAGRDDETKKKVADAIVETMMKEAQMRVAKGKAKEAKDPIADFINSKNVLLLELLPLKLQFNKTVFSLLILDVFSSTERLFPFMRLKSTHFNLEPRLILHA